MSKKTPLYSSHVEKGGKIVEFAGWLLPVEFEGLMKEHLAVRQNVGLFDVSHMGEIHVKGKKAMPFLQKLTTNNVAALKDGQVQYSLMCYADGGIVDDILVHRFNEEHFFLCVNAANIEKDFEWLKKNNTENVDLQNRSDEYAQIAVQGPDAEQVLQKLVKINLSPIPRYWFQLGEVLDVKNVIIARTGYTGEDGFELYTSPAHACKIWEALFEAGKEFNIRPCGLGARDTLRLEVRYPLYGNDIDKTTSPYEAGLGWVVSKKKEEDFIGKKSILARKENSERKKLVGFGLIDRGIARQGAKVYSENNKELGYVSSGTYSPSLKKAIGLAYVGYEHGKIGTEILIKVRDKMLKSKVIKTPFVTGTSLDK